MHSRSEHIVPNIPVLLAQLTRNQHRNNLDPGSWIKWACVFYSLAFVSCGRYVCTARMIAAKACFSDVDMYELFDLDKGEAGAPSTPP